jgi:hypothetical protein
MSWIQTFTGKKFFPLQPDVDQIDILDIAQGLTLKTRFNGQCLQFWSVASHSLAVAHFCPPDLKLWGLLHDAAEAWLPDVPSPLKPNLFYCGDEERFRPEPYHELEDRLLWTVAQKFSLPWPMPKLVKEIDRRVLYTERDWLMQQMPESPWSGDTTVERYDADVLRALPSTPDHRTRDLFLERFVDYSQLL